MKTSSLIEQVKKIMEEVKGEASYPGYGFIRAEFYYIEEVDGRYYPYSRKVYSQSDPNKVEGKPELIKIVAGSYGKQTRVIGLHVSDSVMTLFDHDNRSLSGHVKNIRVKAEERQFAEPRGKDHVLTFDMP